MRKVLLLSGILSSLLYAMNDLLGGLRYPGYRFADQAISELGAAGAPTRGFLLPLGILYTVLALGFGLGVRQAAGLNRRLGLVGALLIAWVVVGSGTLWFPMQQRGAGSLATDAPHIISAAGSVVLMLLTIGLGAFALGPRFRIYSLATLLTVLLFGALTFPLAPRLAAGQPTPRLGIYERINVYASLLWMAVLALALLRRRAVAAQGSLP